MIEHEYRIRLMVHGNSVYEDTVNCVSPKSALNLGFYWLPNYWVERSYGYSVIHAEVSRCEDGQPRFFRSYDHDVLVDASHIRGFNDRDLRSLLRGQDLVWKLMHGDGTPANDMLFKRHHDAYCYMCDKNLIDCYTEHVWVDGWYDEKWSWEDKPAQGYESAKMPEEGTE